MKDLLKIYSRYIGITWIIVVFLIFVNLGGLMVFGIYHVAGDINMFPRSLRGLEKIVDGADGGDGGSIPYCFLLFKPEISFSLWF